MAKGKKPPSKIEQFRTTFFDECAERLIEIEETLSSLLSADEGAQPELLNELFRAVHSIKGGAGAFNFDEIVSVSHALETSLDQMRSNMISADKDALECLLAGRDTLADLIERTKSGKRIPAKQVKEAINNLEALSSNNSVKPAVKISDDRDQAPKPTPQPKHYTIRFKPTARLFETGNDPQLIARELSQLGELKTIVDTALLPPLEKLNPLESYLSWTFHLTTEAPFETIEEVFEFVEGSCALRIEEIKPDETSLQSEQAITPQNDHKGKPIPEAASQQLPSSQLESPSVTSAPQSQPPTNLATKSTAQKISSVRVELDRIDTLVNMVGELVITQAMLEQFVEVNGSLGGETFNRGIETMGSHMRELQDGVMAVRMQPVKAVFARMPRLVRELSRKLQKKVKLTLRGEDTEVDKTIIELLSDPLTHMIRNSLDHGLEMPDARLAAGKPEEAEIVLSAEQRSGRIIIEVIDDGAGINRERVLTKAVERGLVSSTATLQPIEIDDLIFAPGFSTADEVTDVSGRGVGMDVVRRSIHDLGGRVSVISTPGQGTRFIMALPLTLAVMDGMIVRVGQEKYILPLACIIESLRPNAKDIETVMGQMQFVRHRGEYVPLISIASLFNNDQQVIDADEGLIIFVETGMGNTLGLVVNELVGQRQVVIKSLEENYVRINGVSAATILGDGRVALILDIDGMESMIAPNRGYQGQAPLQLSTGNEASL